MKSSLQTTDCLLSVCISVSYSNGAPVLEDFELAIQQGEIMGLVGQSGSGKSTLAMAILGLLNRKTAQVKGEIRFQNSDLLRLSERELRAKRGRSVSLVLQSPVSALNPALRIHTQLSEAWGAHASGSRSDREDAIQAALNSVSLPCDDQFLAKFPSQMSVGQAQRALIAMATLHRPSLLITDEATSALDVITQAEILDLFRRLSRQSGMAILFISHDLISVSGICDRIAILHQGRIVECGETEQMFLSPQHEYTKRLIGTLPPALSMKNGLTPEIGLAAAAAPGTVCPTANRNVTENAPIKKQVAQPAGARD